MIAPVSRSSPAALPADRLGVVLLSAGGPDAPEAVPAFVQRRLCEVRRPWLPRVACRLFARFAAPRRIRALRASLAHAGGHVPDARLVRDLAELVEQTLAASHAEASWTVVAATTAGTPTLADAAARLRAARVERLVAVPLVSVWTEALSAPLVAAWQAEANASGLGPLPLNVVRRFADHPEYACAIRERIGEALQRFPRATRDDVHVVFALHPGSTVAGAGPEASPLFEVVRRVAPLLRHAHRTAFARGWDGAEAAPAVDDTLADLIREGHRHLLIVPIGFVHETMDTVYELDVAARGAAERLGALQFEVAACLNVHEAFVGTVATAVCDVLDMAEAARCTARAA